MNTRFFGSAVVFAAMLMIFACGKTEEADHDHSVPGHTHSHDHSGLDSLYAKSAIRKDGDQYLSENGRFRAFFPGDPDHTVENTPSEFGEVVTHIFTYEDYISKTWLLSYADLPEKLLEASGRDAVLIGAKNGAMATIGAVLAVTERRDTVNGHPGVFFKANSEEYFLVYKIIMAGNRLYQIGIIRKEAFPEENDESEYISTFRILDEDQNG